MTLNIGGPELPAGRIDGLNEVPMALLTYRGADSLPARVLQECEVTEEGVRQILTTA